VLRIRDVVIDCRHPASLARFWVAALDGYQVAPYDEAELLRLHQLGVDDPEDDPTVLVWAGPDITPRLFFQRVPEDRIGKNRLHLDLVAADLELETERLSALGASLLTRLLTWSILADPEGNEFCLVTARTSATA
jgi:Glyoxalase-like domain